jgi:D-alanyl-D-alanine carboxypeptidase
VNDSAVAYSRHRVIALALVGTSGLISWRSKMTGLRLAVVIALGIGLMPPDAQGQNDEAYAERAAALVESYVHSDLFSGSVMVAREGRLLLRKSFGLANREWNIPNTPDTKFRIGSVTKQFTAAAILQLVEAGKLKLDDPIPRTMRPPPRLGRALRFVTC